MMARVLAVAPGLLLLALFPARLEMAGPSGGAPPPREESIPPLPASLSALYPPTAEGPVLLMAMHGVNAPLAAIGADLGEGDREGVQVDFEAFRVRYAEVSELVPEWREWYPAEPVEALGRAVQDGAPESVMAALGRVGAVCHRCHVATMVPVQQKFHWPEFAGISLHDPVLDRDLDYATFMQMLNANLAGIGADLEQRQVENARTQVAALRLRMGELRTSCEACHDAERAYFVDERVEALLTEMATAMDVPEPDPAAIQRLGAAFGEESCFRCHLVHMPAAYSGAARSH